MISPTGFRCAVAALIAVASLLLGLCHTVAEETSQSNASSESSKYWAYRPVVRSEVPTVKHSAKVRTPIDAFLLARLEKIGLEFSPPATKRELIRRATFDLLGLPPTPEEVDAFVNDKSPDAYEKLLDRLLASPHYGERWGR